LDLTSPGHQESDNLRVVATDGRGNSGGWTAYRSYQLANLG
jgi:hypothetical protein